MARKEDQPKKSIFTEDTEELTNRLKQAGYKQISSEDLPEGIVVFHGSSQPRKRRNFVIPRCYAVDDNGLVGWPQIHKLSGLPEDQIDPVEAAIENVLGRQQFISIHKGLNSETYRKRIQGKLRDSLQSQARTV